VNPFQFTCDADRFGLHISDFRDRLCGVVAGFLRDCGERGWTPTLAGAEAALDSFTVPREADELFSILIETPVYDGDSFADLIGEVVNGSQERDADLFRELTRDALRTVKHAFECPRCITCARGKRFPSDRRPNAPVARRVVYV